MFLVLSRLAVHFDLRACCFMTNFDESVEKLRPSLQILTSLQVGRSYFELSRSKHCGGKRQDFLERSVSLFFRHNEKLLRTCEEDDFCYLAICCRAVLDYAALKITEISTVHSFDIFAIVADLDAKLDFCISCLLDVSKKQKGKQTTELLDAVQVFIVALAICRFEVRVAAPGRIPVSASESMEYSEVVYFANRQFGKLPEGKQLENLHVEYDLSAPIALPQWCEE